MRNPPNPSLWSGITRLTLCDVTLSTPNTFARLLCAFPALSRLYLYGMCTFLSHGLDPTGIPTLPVPPTLETLEFSNRLSICSDLQSLADLLDCLVHTGICSPLTTLRAPDFPPSRTTARLVSAVQRLVRQMGDTLACLTLYSGLLCEQQQTGGHTPTTTTTADRYLDVSNNVALKDLRIVVQLDPLHELTSCIPMLVLLTRVTSQHILRIQITFYRALEENAKRRINVKKLMRVLHYLDLILSYPTFDRLETVCLDLSRCGLPFTAEPRIIEYRIARYLPNLSNRNLLDLGVLDDFSHRAYKTLLLYRSYRTPSEARGGGEKLCIISFNPQQAD